MKPIAILGCGPSGLLCAHACFLSGKPFQIFSNPVKSSMIGAMYLHEPIPGITPIEPELEIRILKAGSREGYAENVYGDSQHPVSWDLFDDGFTSGWDIGAAYDRLWNLYGEDIQRIDHIDPPWLLDLIATKEYDCIFSTIPKPSICRNAHLFNKQDIWVVSKYDPDDSHNVLYYNGIVQRIAGAERHQWYRYSVINHWQSWEYSRYPSGHPDTPQLGIKPIDNNCDCFPTVHKFGRFGRWEKKVLTHHAFNGAMDVVRAL